MNIVISWKLNNFNIKKINLKYYIGKAYYYRILINTLNTLTSNKIEISLTLSLFIDKNRLL